MVVWDSQVKDGYKRSQAPAADGGVSGDTPTRAAATGWDGKKSSGVVEELLRNSTDKAYGANGECLSNTYEFLKYFCSAEQKNKFCVWLFIGYLFVFSSPQLGWRGFRH